MNIIAKHKEYRKISAALFFVLAVAIHFFAAPPDLFATNDSQKGFSTPKEAVKCLVASVKADDLNKLIAILGPGSEELIYSGDEVADRSGRKKFIKAYDKKNSIDLQSENTMILHIGPDNWPLPIPIVKKDGKWFFDIKEGKNEILNRRIGRNELHVMETLNAYVDAQHEYATKDCNKTGNVVFAQKFVSSEGKCDGLYWELKEGEEESPFGPLMARAADEGYGKVSDLSPFHGYYYKILKAQGKHAEGGAYDYVIKGKMILGFALIAYPAEYGNSGVMTFLVNQEGIIYEKDLGKDTKKIAEAMKIFDPDKTWKKTEAEKINSRKSGK